MGLLDGGGLVDVNVDQVIVTLRLVEDRAHSFDLLVAGAAVATGMDNKIEAEGQVGPYPRWPELSDAVKHRRAGAKMLRGPTGLLAQFQVVPESSRSVLVQSPAPYAGYHVTGHLIPRRDFTEIDMDTVLEEAGARLVSHIVEGR